MPAAMSRVCASCRQMLPPQSFTPPQYALPPGHSVCTGCERPPLYAHASARRIRASRADFATHDLRHPFAQGSFRWVARGRYTEGPRAGEQCVCKWFKSGSVFSREFFTHDIRAVDTALMLVSRFNEARVADKMVRLNIPEVWRFAEGSGDWSGALVLQEPYIENYQKFNSNTGWNDNSSPWGQVMQALSHFSFHISQGEYLLCDLQGGIYPETVVLTDPVVMSRRREFGVTDLGPDGIHNFFKYHVCNAFCNPTWSRPTLLRSSYLPIPNTTMVARQTPRNLPSTPPLNFQVVSYAHGGSS